MSLWENDAGVKCLRTAGQWIAHDAKASNFNKFFDLFVVQWILLCNFATDIASAELPLGTPTELSATVVQFGCEL